MLIHPQFNPVALQIGPVAVHWYGLTYLAAFALFVWLARQRLAHPDGERLGAAGARKPLTMCCFTACWA